MTLGLLVGICVTAGFSWSTWHDSRGADADAVVAEVEKRGLRSHLTVRFPAPGGRTCEAPLAWASGQSELRPGDHVRIHHPAGDPCVNVRQADDQDGWEPVIFSALMTLGLAVATYLTWRPPHIPPPRYADMP